jgi:CelD/BcsL family acetyltransferase involved in cellulose biosynthesis
VVGGSLGSLRPEVLPAVAVDGAAWDRLAEASGNVFATREWSDAWLRHVEPGADPLVVACRDGVGEIAALWPLRVQRRGPLRLLRLAGHGPADELGPVCAPADRDAAARALRGALDAGMLPGSVVLAERLPTGTDWPGLLRGRALVSEPSPVLPTEGRTFDEFLQSRSGQFRNQVRRYDRRLERGHHVEVRLVERPEELAPALDVLLALHGGRWGEASDAFAPPLDRFHRGFAAAALARGWLRLWTLRVDGEPAAAWYGFRFGGADAFYQSGRDPRLDRLKVGGVLLARTIRATFDDGLREYRFLRGGEDYKRRWTDVDRPVLTLAASAGRAGRPVVAGAAAVAGSPRLRAAARRIVRGT